MENHRLLCRALDILEIVSLRPKGLLFSEICDCISGPKSSLSVLAHTLERRGYLSYDEATSRYRIGVKSFETGIRFLEKNNLKRHISDILARMSRESNETVHLAILDRLDVIYLEKFESSHSIRMASAVGRRLPAYSTAIGKALLIGYEKEELRKFYQNVELERLQKNTIIDKEVLFDQIDMFRSSSITEEIEESTLGIRCVAAPIREKNKKVLAAVSIAVPIFRADDKLIENIVRIVRDGAAEISALVAYSDSNIF